MRKRENEPVIILAMAVLDLKYECVICLFDSLPYLDGRVMSPGALLPHSRNTCINGIYDKFPDFTHVIFVDDDMCKFGPQHMQKLLKNDVDICSALVTYRMPPYSIVAAFDDSEVPNILTYIQNKEVREVEHVGMAFTMIKRSVLDAVKEDTPDGPIWFTMDREPRENFDVETSDKVTKLLKSSDFATNTRGVLEEAILFGQQSHLNTHVIGEDIAFCKRAKKAGFKIFVDCGVPVGHLGDQICTFATNAKYVKEHNDAKPVQPVGVPDLRVVTV